MRISSWAVVDLLTITVANASGQMRDYHDTYTSSEAGKPMAPAKALDVMLSQFETQVLAAAQAQLARYQTQAAAAAPRPLASALNRPGATGPIDVPAQVTAPASVAATIVALPAAVPAGTSKFNCASEA